MNEDDPSSLSVIRSFIFKVHSIRIEETGDNCLDINDEDAHYQRKQEEVVVQQLHEGQLGFKDFLLVNYNTIAHVD